LPFPKPLPFEPLSFDVPHKNGYPQSIPETLIFSNRPAAERGVTLSAMQETTRRRDDKNGQV
jgi:hypothetical protein